MEGGDESSGEIREKKPQEVREDNEKIAKDMAFLFLFLCLILSKINPYLLVVVLWIRLMPEKESSPILRPIFPTLKAAKLRIMYYSSCLLLSLRRAGGYPHLFLRSARRVVIFLIDPRSL